MTDNQKTTVSQAACNPLCPQLLARYYSTKPVPDGELLAHGWRAAKTDDGIEFVRTLGGQGTPFVTYDLTVSKRGEFWVPSHGSVEMSPMGSSASAANALMRYWQNLSWRDKLTAQNYQAMYDGAGRKSMFLLVEVVLGDDAYGERLPAAFLVKFNHETVHKVDKVARLIQEGVLSERGAHVALPAEDVALIGRVGFSEQNTLASLPGFFDAETDHVIGFSNSFDMEIDEEKVDFLPLCEPFSPDEDDTLGGIDICIEQIETEGLMISFKGRVSTWNLGGYLSSWTVVREQIATALRMKSCTCSCDLPEGHVAIDRETLRLVLASADAHVQDVESGLEVGLYSKEDNADLLYKQVALEAAQKALLV